MNDTTFAVGGITVYPRTVLAPLAGITNLPFRAMVKNKGCGLVCSEMVSANGLVYGSNKTQNMMARNDGESPLSVQIFGSEPGPMAEAARMVEGAGADILDINFGCSVKKVVKTGAGVALMSDLYRSEKILTAVKNAISIPVTIKLRSGWDASGEQALRIAQIAQCCGIDAICLHPRTAKQGFSGKADWSLIARMKQRLSIPLIGNGDIVTPDDAVTMITQTGCDGVMIGRATLADPDIFRRTAHRLAGTPCPPLTLVEHMDMIRRFLDDSVEYQGEAIACPLMRSRLGFLVKGLPGAGAFRKELCALSTRESMRELIDSFEENLLSEDARHLVRNCEWSLKAGA
jgi:tRNA-dihydrouridine synthase B